MKTMMIKNDCPLAGCGLRQVTTMVDNLPIKSLLSPCEVLVATILGGYPINVYMLLSPCGVWIATGF